MLSKENLKEHLSVKKIKYSDSIHHSSHSVIYRSDFKLSQTAYPIQFDQKSQKLCKISKKKYEYKN